MQKIIILLWKYERWYAMNDSEKKKKNRMIKYTSTWNFQSLTIYILSESMVLIFLYSHHQSLEVLMYNMQVSVANVV